MADNFSYTPGTGETGGADDIDGVKYPRVKLIHGADGTNDGDVSSANPLPVDATGAGDVPITLDGEAVTANLGATDNAVLDDIASKLGTIDADTSTVAAAVSTEMQVDVVGSLPAGTNAIGKLAANSGVDIGDVDVKSLPTLPAGTNLLGSVGIDQTTDGTTNKVSLSTDVVAVDATGQGDVPITLDGEAVTANLGATDNAVLDDIAAKLATIDADTSALAGAVDTQLQVDVVGALPAGTNAIGKLSANSGVDIGDVDVLSLPATPAGTNAIGKLLPPDVDVTAHANYARKYYTSAEAVTDGVIWSPAAGKRWHVTTMYIQVSADATVTLEDDLSAGDSPVWKGELAAKSGVVLQFNEKYPLASEEDAADLLITTSAGAVYVTAVGYEI